MERRLHAPRVGALSVQRASNGADADETGILDLAVQSLAGRRQRWQVGSPFPRIVSDILGLVAYVVSCRRRVPVPFPKHSGDRPDSTPHPPLSGLALKGRSIAGLETVC